MPKSKSKREAYKPPPKPNPPPSPRWVPVGGVSLIVVGIALILLNYIFPSLIPIGNWSIIVGFVLMAVGLGFLSQWR